MNEGKLIFFPPKKDADAFRRILNERRRNFCVPLEQTRGHEQEDD